MAEIKGTNLEDLAERLGVPTSELVRRKSQATFQPIRVRVHQSTMAGTVCRVKLAESQVELLEEMIRIALTPGKNQAQMLLGLRDVVLPSGLQNATAAHAASAAQVNHQIAASMAKHVEQLRELAPPQREISTPILAGKDALPSATRLSPDDSD